MRKGTDKTPSAAVPSPLPCPPRRRTPRAPCRWAHHSHHVRAGLVSQTKMYLRSGDGLLLQQQARANLNLTAHTKWINALIAERLLGVRPHDLPMIIFRPVIDGLQRSEERRVGKECR